MKKAKSPCIDVCKFIGPNGWCLGCGRTRDETRKWKSLKPYDIQALIPIIKGAGGEITTFDGGNPSMGGNVVASANSSLHRQVLEILND